MKESLLIGGGIVLAGVFVGFVAYKLVTKNPKVLKNARAKASKTAAKAKQAFAEGFESAQAKAATA